MNVTRTPVTGRDRPQIRIYFTEDDYRYYRALVTGLQALVTVPIDPTRQHAKQMLKLLGEKVPD